MRASGTRLLAQSGQQLYEKAEKEVKEREKQVESTPATRETSVAGEKCIPYQVFYSVENSPVTSVKKDYRVNWRINQSIL